MGVLNHAEYRPEQPCSNRYGGGQRLRSRVDIMFCDPGTSHAGKNDRAGIQNGQDRSGQGRADSGAGATPWDALTRYWRGSCMAVSHRLKCAEDRAEKLARSFGVHDDD